MNTYHSKKREQIVELFKDGSLLTAKAICSQLPNIDRATIYRTLSTLVKLGTLREVHLYKEYSHYELMHEGDTHQHFICTQCDKILPIEVEKDLVTQLLPDNVEALEFELNVKGTCNDCK